MKKKLLSVLLCGAMAAAMLAGCSKGGDTGANAQAGGETASAIPQDYKYYYSFDQADDKESIRKVTCEAGSTMVPVEKEKNYIPGVKGEALYNDGVFGYDLEDVNGVGNSYTISYWTYCQRSALYMPNTIWGPDIKGNKDIGAEQWAAFDWLASDDDSTQQVFPGIWSNEGAGVGRAEWKAAGADPQTGHWMHLALVVDENNVSADGNLYYAKVYVDGQEYQKITNGEVVPVSIVKSAMAPADSFEFLLGINYWDAVFKGAFDELYIYDRALDASEIAALAADGDSSVALQEPERVIEPVASAEFITALGDLSLKAEEGKFTSDAYPIKDGETFKFSLKNWSDGADVKNNYILKFATEGKDIATIYADASGTVNGTDITNDFTYTWGNWNSWLQNTMREASPVITVSRTGDEITLSCDNVDIYGSVGANVANVTFATGVADDEAINLTFTNKDSYVEILSVKDMTAKAGGIVVGNTDRTTGWWSAFSDIFGIGYGETVTKTFTNYNDGGDNWHNFVVILQNTPTGHSADTEGYAEYAVVRADNFGWGAGYDGIATAECDWNWDTFMADMDGAKITTSITNNGETADISIVAETTTGAVYHQTYTGIDIAGGDLYACFSCEASYLSFDTVTVGNTDRTSPFWTAFSDIYAVPEGSSKTIYFKNYTSGAENWNNFNVVLQNTPTGHSAEATEGYAEYAVVRSDNYGWGAGYDGICTPSCDWNWDSFKADMDGAYVALTVFNRGETADVHARVTTADGSKIYTQDYPGIAIDGDLYFCLVMDGSYVTIESERVGNTDLSSGFWTAFSNIYPVREGDTVYKSFTNYTSGAENWNNFNVVLQNTPTGHSAETTEGYAEYAVVRSDNYGWGAGYEGIVTPECNWNWDSFKEDMNGAHVLVAVTNNGDTADVKAYVTTEAGATYTQSYTGIAVDGDLYFTFVMDGSYILIDGQ